MWGQNNGGGGGGVVCGSRCIGDVIGYKKREVRADGEAGGGRMEGRADGGRDGRTDGRTDAGRTEYAPTDGV